MAGRDEGDGLAVLTNLLRPQYCLPVRAADEAPDCGGAYALAICLGVAVEAAFAGKVARLEPGLYIYAGSAYGPGGIRARLRRHFRRDKKLHWHVDRLTNAASSMAAVAVAAGRECAIVERLAASAGFTPVLAGFGSSDCRRCTTHLLKWQGLKAQTGLYRSG
jgi:Uri superfamily endonuclease